MDLTKNRYSSQYIHRKNNASEAPIGAWVYWLGSKYVKKFTDQEVWIKSGQSGLIGAITYDDREYSMLEQAWSQNKMEKEKTKSEIRRAEEKLKSKLDNLNLKMLKAPASQKEEILIKKKEMEKEITELKQILIHQEKFSGE